MRNLLVFLPILTAAHPLDEFKSTSSPNFNAFFNFPKNEIQNGEQLVSKMKLPRTVIPTNYDLHLKVYLPDYETVFEPEKNFTFEGTVAIDFDVKEGVEEIILNQLELEIETVELQYKGMSVLLNFHIDNTLERVKVQTFLIEGPGTLILRYKGIMGPYYKSPIGLFKTAYTKDGKTLYAAVTQMEAHDARRMVPCFDEPEYKAVWDVTLVHPVGTNALGNQEIKKIRERGDWLETSFETTPVMSSYLLAIHIANMNYVEGETKSGIRVKIHYPEDQSLKQSTLQIAIQCFDFFEDLFEIPVPLNKTDMVVTKDFMFGAMENWGLIVFNAISINNPNIICHEIAHYWFGNLVTLRFWEYIWLNEGWTTFMANEAVNNIFNLSFSASAIRAGRQFAMKEDLGPNRYPLVRRLIHHKDIMNFDSHIFYTKGALIIHMIKQILGEDIFYAGVKNYLNKFAYKNVMQSDVFAAFDEVVPKDILGPNGRKFNVTRFAARWTYQMGFPLVKLYRNETHCLFTQERYTTGQIGVDDPRYEKNVFKYKWDIPIWLNRDSKEEFHWLPFNKDLFLPCDKKDKISINQREDGYYKVNMDRSELV